jgi:Uma2 family endonuclease
MSLSDTTFTEMTMADVQTALLTGDDLLEIVAENPDKRYELIEGELIEMNPTGVEHGKLEFRVGLTLARYNDEHKWGTILTGEMGFYTRSGQHTVRAADVAFISYDRMPPGELPEGYGSVPPELVVEIVSPTDRAINIEEKVQEWLDFGVNLVWVVYPKTRRVHVYTHGNPIVVLNEQDTLTGGDVLPGFSAPVSAIFAD